MLHKSVGLCLAGLILVRVPMRLKSAVPPAVAGNALEQTAAKLSHLALYAFSIVMPVTGVAMGIFGGKGIPFFGLGTVPGLDPKQSGKGWIAGKAFKLHKQAGRFFEYFVPIHIGAVGFLPFGQGPEHPEAHLLKSRMSFSAVGAWLCRTVSCVHENYPSVLQVESENMSALCPLKKMAAVPFDTAA